MGKFVPLCKNTQKVNLLFNVIIWSTACYDPLWVLTYFYRFKEVYTKYVLIIEFKFWRWRYFYKVLRFVGFSISNSSIFNYLFL